MSKIDQENIQRATLSLAIINADALSVKDLMRECEVYNIATSHFTELKELVASIQGNPNAIPDIVLIEQASPKAYDDLPAFNESIREHLTVSRKRPLQLSYSDDQTLEAKLVAAKAKVDAFLEKPIKCHQLVEKLDEMIFTHNEDPLRIMIVDDTLSSCTVIATILEDAGMNTLVILNPKHAFSMLDVFQPDLVLIDLYMPEISGSELARAIRYYPKYDYLSLVFISSEEDVTKQMEALESGADDFLIKSIPATALAVSIEAKAKRSRYFGSQNVKDNLTGLYHYNYCYDRLFHRMERAQRNNLPLAVAFLSVDNFKQINDHYGHTIGDAVLRVIAHILQHRLRKSDIIGRNIGVGFFIIMPDTSEQAAFAILDNLRDNFSRVQHECQLDGSSPEPPKQTPSFKSTLSASIACFPKYKTVNDLISAAESGLTSSSPGDMSETCNKVTLA